MKRKGIHPLEQHVEKIFVGVLALGLVGVLLLQFLTTPNAVTVDGQDVQPSGIFGELSDKADRLLSQVNDDDPSLPDVDTPDLSGPLEAAIEAGSLLATRPAPAVGLTPRTVVAVGGEAPSPDPISPLEVPAAFDVIASGQWGALDPYFVDAYPESRAVLASPEQPFDVASVSVEATFSGTALLAALQGGGDDGEAGAGGRSIPERWWRGRMEIVGVELERQSRLPGDESWSEAEIVPRPFWVPPIASLLIGPQDDDAVTLDDLTPPDLQRLVEIARREPGLASRHPFMPTIAGPLWRPPHLTEDVDGDLAMFEEQARLTASLERERDRLERLENAERDADTITRQIERTQEQIESLEIQLEELREAQGLADEREDDERRGPGENDGLPLLSTDAVRVWSHDVGVEPGLEYRYRLRVLLPNPLFGRERALGPNAPEVLAQASEPLVASPWSEWGNATPVDRREFFFLTNAAERGSLVGLGNSSATAVIYRMFYGYYRADTVTLEPGSPAFASIEIDDEQTPLFTFDVDLAEPDEIARFLGELDGERDPRDRAGRVRPDPRDRDRGRDPDAGRDRDRGRTPDRDPGRSPPRDLSPDPTDDGEEERPLPLGVERLAATAEFPLSVVLIDVADRPDEVDGRVVQEVFLFDPQLGVVVRSPQSDRAGAAFRRVDLSARRGEIARLREPRPVFAP